MMSQSISTAITELYRKADLSLPTVKRRVVLLNELLGGYNLTCIEIAGLTSEAASNLLLRRGAILEPLKNTSRDFLAGYIYASNTGGFIFVERTDLLVRRRFSVAHELGHYVLHLQPLITKEALSDAYELVEISEALAPFPKDEDAEDIPTGQIYPPGQVEFASLLPPYEQMEHEANQFAAALLMPEEVVRGLVARYGSVCRKDDLIWRLSTEMLVSRAAVQWRLHDLRLSHLVTASWN